MTEHQIANSKNCSRLLLMRLVAAGVFLTIIAVFYLLRASSKGTIDLSYWFGVCGFKQRFGLPCLGCGWTHAAEMFAAGHFLKAFTIQPAAAFFCVVFLLVAIFALHSAVFGINSWLLKRIFSPKSVTVMLVASCVVIIAGWLVNLVRAILEN